MGHPDVQSMQTAVMAEMGKHVLDEMDCLSPETFMKTCATPIFQGPEQLQAAFMKIF
ncbi:DUF6489 family protein [Methylobacterium trifolii]|uniref:DUF6489 family protein n=1 Tax=Methylobacterium trifolii TaxID=1003092 RepID=UPI0035A24125